MTLADLLKAIDKLSPDEFNELYSHFEQRRRGKNSMTNTNKSEQEDIMASAGMLNMDELNMALSVMREGLSDADFAAIEEAMNVEYIEPLDD